MKQKTDKRGGLRTPPGGRPRGPNLKPIDLALSMTASILTRALSAELKRGAATRSPPPEPSAAVCDVRQRVAWILTSVCALREDIERIEEERSRPVAAALAALAATDPDPSAEPAAI